MTGKEIVIFSEKKILEALTTENGLRPILDKVREAAKEFGDDVSTATSRKAIIAGSRKVVTFKTMANRIGKDSVSEAREQIKRVDGNLKSMRDELDEIRDEVRKPVTEWEEAEEKRVEVLMDKIEDMRSLGATVDPVTGQTLMLDVLQANLKKLDALEVSEKIFGKNYEMDAFKAKSTSLQTLTMTIEREETRIAQEKELETLRAEAKARAEREAEEKREREAKEAAEKEEARQKAHDAEVARKAKEEAELAAKKAEADRIEAQKKALEEAKKAAEKAKQAEAKAEEARIQAEKDAEEAAKKAEADRIEAQKKALEEAKKAAEKAAAEAKAAEIKRQKDEQAKKDAAEKLRREPADKFEATNEEYMRKIKLSAATVLADEFQLADELSMDIITLIEEGGVPYVRITS